MHTWYTITFPTFKEYVSGAAPYACAFLVSKYDRPSSAVLHWRRWNSDFDSGIFWTLGPAARARFSGAYVYDVLLFQSGDAVVTHTYTDQELDVLWPLDTPRVPESTLTAIPEDVAWALLAHAELTYSEETLDIVWPGLKPLTRQRPECVGTQIQGAVKNGSFGKFESTATATAPPEPCLLVAFDASTRATVVCERDRLFTKADYILGCPRVSKLAQECSMAVHGFDLQRAKYELPAETRRLLLTFPCWLRVYRIHDHGLRDDGKTPDVRIGRAVSNIELEQHLGNVWQWPFNACLDDGPCYVRRDGKRWWMSKDNTTVCKWSPGCLHRFREKGWIVWDF